MEISFLTEEDANAVEVEFTIITLTEDTKEIGSIEDTTAMESSLWSKGSNHGFGVQTCADGSSYVRKFKSGLKHGLGSYHFRNGDKHAGEYFRDKIHGFGVYHFPSGHYYEGAWHEGRKQRYGTYGFITGDTECGEWDDGNRLSPDTGLLRKAVQSAQEMARKGVDQRRVHEQWYGL
ncbi:hypothetical protein Bca52824_082933 [Brassica carinata]|uniref:Uncharacterized protein n=1 Tax=Brassica carinata TaxID=52824 RepID=A0A8X7TSM5_BRACI|nr:hypothetical protein Bca52824_082933 [Brassica carinata]